jgi:hypothetical protein
VELSEIQNHEEESSVPAEEPRGEIDDSKSFVEPDREITQSPI